MARPGLEGARGLGRLAAGAGRGPRAAGGDRSRAAVAIAPPPRLRRAAGQPARHRPGARPPAQARSEEHTSELQSLMRISYAVFCLKKKNIRTTTHTSNMTQHL